MNVYASNSHTRIPEGLGNPQISKERCILAGLKLRQTMTGSAIQSNSLTAEESMEELAELASSAGAQVLGYSLQVRDRPVPATYIGTGKLSELNTWASEEDCDFVLFNQDLSATQHRNLEKKLGRTVLDRTQLILDIFASHARSREGKLQVELAQLNYLLPRLMGRGTAMSRLGGGIGTRGPGETQLEHDRRKIRKRIVKLRNSLEKVRSSRSLQRSKRISVPLPTIALCGYTNAGKSTLFNKLTNSFVLADSRMFATLDPTLRKLRLPSRRNVLLSDTVGFIRNLPPALIKAFRATLEEVVEASMILHVVDVSSTHSHIQQQEVDHVLKDIGATGKPGVLVLNKCDLCAEHFTARSMQVEQSFDPETAVVKISAKTGEGMDQLLKAIDSQLTTSQILRRRFLFPYSESSKLSALYEQGRVLERRDGDDVVKILAELPEELVHQWQAFSTEH